VLVQPILPFFFSSRRRHTRFSRDWSSDVCSSDLTVSFLSSQRSQNPRARYDLQETSASSRDCVPRCRLFGRELLAGVQVPHEGRSEERRVGKESTSGSSRWDRPKQRTRAVLCCMI